MNKFYYILFLFLLASCEKEIKWQLQEGDKDLLVVESLLTNENKVQTVKLTKAVSELNTAPVAASGAVVTLNDGDSTYNLVEVSQKPGLYRAAAPLIGVVGKTYELQINYRNEQYSAQTYMLPVSRFKPLQYIKNKNGKYIITHINNVYSRDEQAMYEVRLDWSHVPGYESLEKSQTSALIYSFTFNTISTSQIFAPDKATLEFPKGTRIIEKKYSLNPAFADYLRAVVAETEWKGGLFDTAPANAPTNLTGDALGFFGASSVVSDSIIVR